jgi:hypothetical protein
MTVLLARGLWRVRRPRKPDDSASSRFHRPCFEFAVARVQPCLELCGPRSLYRQLRGPFSLLLLQKFDGIGRGPLKMLSARRTLAGRLSEKGQAARCPTRKEEPASSGVGRPKPRLSTTAPRAQDRGPLFGNCWPFSRIALCCPDWAGCHVHCGYPSPQMRTLPDQTGGSGRVANGKD